jgi:2-hydroxychromene-2-carboxylate isomerase
MAQPPKGEGKRTRMPRQVDYYFSLSSPWAYIGHKVFRDRSRPTT